MAAVPFGFSFGDFAAAIELIHKAAQALRRTSGAPSSFHQAIADLGSFEIVLRKVEALSPTTSSLDTIEAIRLCAFKCHPPLNHFLHRIRIYEAHKRRLSGSKAKLVSGITVSFFKVKWAVKVEEEVTKLKADIGPLLAAINVLLQIESRKQGAETYERVNRLIKDVTSGFDRICLAVQDQALATSRIDVQTLEVHHDTQTVVQQLPQLATSGQLGALLRKIESVSAVVGSTATKDQVDQLTSLLQASSATQLVTMAVVERQQAQTIQTGQTVQDVYSLLVATRLPNHADPDPTTTSTFGRPASMPPPSTASSGMSPNVRDHDKMAARRPHSLLSMICQLFVSAIMALVLSFPNIQSQLRIFVTLLKTPSLLSSNSVTVTDALNRTKRLPYEYFSH